MHKVMRTATSYIVLISAILSHGSSFGADVSNSAQKDHAQRGMVASVKRSIRKVYDCIRGNTDTCTADEIMAARALLIVLASKFIIAPMHTAFKKRASHAARAHATAATHGRRYRTGVRASDFDDAVTASMASAAGAGRTVASVDVDKKAQLKQKWNEWLRHNSADQVGVDCDDIECFVCMNEDNTDLARIPCSGREHSEKICLECVSKLVASGGSCPMCRAALISLS